MNSFLLSIHFLRCIIWLCWIFTQQKTLKILPTNQQSPFVLGFLQKTLYESTSILLHLFTLFRCYSTCRSKICTRCHRQELLLLTFTLTLRLILLMFAIPGPLPNPGILGLGFCNPGIPGLILESKSGKTTNGNGSGCTERQCRSYRLHRPAY